MVIRRQSPGTEQSPIHGRYPRPDLSHGGWNGSAGQSAVYSAPLNGDGTIGTWGTDSNLPSDRREGGTAIVNNHIYLFGGYDSAAPTPTIYEAPFSGGANDYTNEVVTTSGLFRLPDYTNATIGTEAAYYYIKT